MTARIHAVRGREVLDSRGSPTVEVAISLTDGREVRASVPSGRSKGTHEATELRDQTSDRYRGRGVLRAVDNVNSLIAPVLIGRDATKQTDIDAILIDLDDTPNKSKLGANATLAVSLATARAGALASGIPLWRYLANGTAPLLPMPMVNIISGGLHAGRNLDVQDFLVVPVGAESFSAALEMCVAVYASTADLLAARGLSVLKADEGGFGPALKSNAIALDLLVEAIQAAGYAPGEDMALALDVAATHFYDQSNNSYFLRLDGRVCDATDMVEMLSDWADRYPIVSIEDGLAEDDWSGWQQLTTALGSTVQLLGDDLFTTNLSRLDNGIRIGAANAVLVKMNQIGTLTETIAVIERAQRSGFRPVISARSGETEDSALADIAVATGAGQIKVGSVAQSDRLAKYNQLLRIEEMLQPNPAFAGRGALTGNIALKEARPVAAD